MAITDNKGNKLPQSRVNKKILSAAFRNLRIQQRQNINPAFCNMCGYRVRSLNHESGTHHQQAV